jgi:DNA-binding LacI/PurR family transcriptional regulator
MVGKIINIKEFSKLLGVSTATVSRAFSGRGRISGKTRDMIRARAAELGYRANIHARSLTTRRTDRIGIFYPSISMDEPDYFIAEILLSVSRAAAEAGKALQTHPITENDKEPEMFLDYILSGSFEGIVTVAGSKASNLIAETAGSAGIPNIVIGRMPGAGGASVVFQTEEGARLAGAYFKRVGRKNPAYVRGVLDRRKQQGFIDGLGPELAARLTVDAGGSSFADGHTAYRRLMAANPASDCVFCANDVLAIGFIKAAMESSRRIPEDIAVIGCDDIKVARYFTPSLSTIALHEREIGERAVSALLKMMRGETSPPGCDIVSCDLVLRASA